MANLVIHSQVPITQCIAGLTTGTLLLQRTDSKVRDNMGRIPEVPHLLVATQMAIHSNNSSSNKGDHQVVHTEPHHQEAHFLHMDQTVHHLLVHTHLFRAQVHPSLLLMALLSLLMEDIHKVPEAILLQLLKREVQEAPRTINHLLAHQEVQLHTILRRRDPRDIHSPDHHQIYNLLQVEHLL
jgi:hypothetical protein